MRVTFRRSFLAVSLLVLAACAGSGAADTSSGPSSLMSLDVEPAGANCAAGGTKVSVGPDTNGNGKLDASEIKDTKYVCNGEAGESAADAGAPAAPAPLLNVETEPKGANCASGGLRVETGLDQDRSGTLDASEVTSTKYVCNGASPDAGSTGGVVSSYVTSSIYVSSQATSTTVQTLSFAAPGPGKLVALFSGDVLCASPAINQGYDCSTNTVTAGYLTLSTNASADANSGDGDYFYLSPNATESLARHTVIDVAAAGNVTVYGRAKMAGAGAFSVYDRTLTLLFVPS